MGNDGEAREGREEREEREEELQQKRLDLLTAWARATATEQVRTQNARLTRWRERSRVVDAFVVTFLRDRSIAGTVLGSALAFRLFLFFIPVVLVVVGLLGFLGQWFDAVDVKNATSITGEMASQIDAALSQSGSGRWVAVLVGLFGMATAGRALSRVMQASSAMAWRTEIKLKVGVRVLVNVVGILVALALLAVLVNRVRDNGVAAAGLSVGVALAVYVVGWIVMCAALPRGTTDPGAGIPGAVLVGVTLVGLQIFTQWYLPRQITGASQLYGAIGSAIALLGWFFIIGRVMVLSFVVDAVVYEYFGSLSQLVFSLPVLRIVPRKVPAVARFFDLEPDDPQPGGVTPAESGPPRDTGG
jgi:uncharacterized BrkB/YihY/UPF0761 family membrane protein